MAKAHSQIRAWPATGIEPVPACPVCGSSARAKAITDLKDEIFFSAPGEWSMSRCGECRSLYLDPRPTEASIHIAYDGYYTHQPEGEYRSDGGEASPGKRKLGLGALKAVVRNLFSGVSEDYVSRVGAPPRPGARLLDIGCGNGGFLTRAGAAGWDVFGCDFDPGAVRTARAVGAEVRLGGAETFLDQQGSFDAITLSHVIEHVYRPSELLDICWLLLSEKGRIFIDTPNSDALGLKIYSRHWRGLEPPRHLVLFNWESLERSLKAAGFQRPERLPQRRLALSVWLASDRIRSGASPYDAGATPSRRFWREFPLLMAIPENRTEFVTLTAEKVTS